MAALRVDKMVDKMVVHEAGTKASSWVAYLVGK